MQLLRTQRLAVNNSNKSCWRPKSDREVGVDERKKRKFLGERSVTGRGQRTVSLSKKFV